MSEAAIWISAKCSPAQTSFQAYHSWTLMKCPAARQLVMGDSKHCDNAPCPPCPCVHVWWSPMISDGLWLWICEVPTPGAPRQQHSYKSHKSGWKYQLRQRLFSEKTCYICTMIYPGIWQCSLRGFLGLISFESCDVTLFSQIALKFGKEWIKLHTN